jgi:hypothetical protein
MESLSERLRCDAADVGRIRVIEAGHADEQENFARGRRQRGERPLDAPLEFAGRGRLERRRPFDADGPQRHEACRGRVLDHP